LGERAFARIGRPDAVTLLALLPLDYLWWQLLGYLP
jgi:hypothetical protein